MVESWASGLTHRQATHIPHPRRRHVTQGRHPTSCMAKQPPPLGEGEGHGPRTFPSQASATPPRARARQTRQWLDPGWSSSPTSPTRSSSPPEILLFSRHSESFPPASKCQELIAPRDPAFQPPLGKLPPRTEAYRPLPHLSAAPGFPPVKGPEVYRPPGSCFSAAPQKLPPLPQMVVYRPLPHFSAAPGFPPMM